MVDGREGSCFVSLLAVADDLPDRCKSQTLMSGHGEDDSLGTRDFCNFAAMGLLSYHLPTHWPQMYNT